MRHKWPLFGFKIQKSHFCDEKASKKNVSLIFLVNVINSKQNNALLPQKCVFPVTGSRNCLFSQLKCNFFASNTFALFSAQIFKKLSKTVHIYRENVYFLHMRAKIRAATPQGKIGHIHWKNVHFPMHRNTFHSFSW